MKKATKGSNKRKSAHASEYSGLLLTPIELRYKPVEAETPSKPAATILDTHFEIDLASISSQIDDRMSALLDHFNIDPNGPQCWWWLAYRLAQKSGIPGFQIDDGAPKKKQGRPVYWSNLRKLQLWADVEVVRDRHRNMAHAPTVHAVCGWFISGARPTSRWHEAPDSKSKSWLSTLCDRYTEGKGLAVKMRPRLGPRPGWLPWKIRRSWIIGRYAEHVPADNPYRGLTTLLTSPSSGESLG
jgi:hypothetical protein